jgi:aminoglycoside phosphotransferase family enzyme/predicted kinase
MAVAPGDRPALPPLVRALLRPAFYPHRPARVRLEQTHISWVFVAGSRVYKIKKPVDFGFLDFSSLRKRAQACRREVELNRRLAPGLYLGVAPLYERCRPSLPGTDLESAPNRHCEYSLSPPGRVVDYAVVMRLLPQRQLLSALLARGAATAADLRRVARRIARFHAAAAPAAPRWRRVAALAENLRENFRQTVPFLDRTVSGGDYLLVWDYNHDFLERRRPLLQKRAREGRIRDGHGDLHAEHVSIERSRVRIYDCIEFSERLRQGDVAADIAFLYMDLLHHRRADLAAALMDEYLRRTGDWEVRLLVPFYACYRAVVREKVESLRLADLALTGAHKRAAARRAAGYFRLARDLARRDARPRLFLVGGLPGSGKSTVAAALAGRVGADCIASDLLRKELAGAAPGERLGAAVGAGAYTAGMSALTYRELLLQAERQLRAGHSVVLDATFGRAPERRRAAALARAVGGLLVPVACRCPQRVARERLAVRAQPGYAGPSDAGWEVYRAMRRTFAPWPDAVPVDTTKPLESCLATIAERAYPL